MSSHRILIGVDDSPGSQRAVEWAANYARRAQPDVIAAHILTVDDEFWRDMPPSNIATWRDRMRANLEGAWTAPLRDMALRCTLFEADSVESGLLHLADTEDVELIVLGSHGRGGLKDRLLGAVTYKVSHHSHRPVVIVPADWHGIEGGA